MTTTTEGDKKGKKDKRKKSKRIYRTSQNIRIINIFLESLLSVLSLAGSHSPPRLPRMPSNLCWSLDLLWGQLRFKSGPMPVCSCLQCPQLSELVHFLLWELSMSFYVFHTHRVCLVDRVVLICSLYSWWEGFGSSSLATLALGFDCDFVSTSACESFTGVCS